METKNVYQKLQAARVELQTMKLKKSGKNAFQKYSYYELSDFLPQVNSIFNKSGLVTQFSMTDKATMTVVNADIPDQCIVFECPLASLDLKGGQPIQNLGAQITYLRRYLVMVALEIVESDFVDGQNQVVSAELDNVSLYKLQAAKSVSELTTVATELKKSGINPASILPKYNEIKSLLEKNTYESA